MSTPRTADKGRTWAAPRVPPRVAFLAAACSLVFVFAAAGTPIPLYNTYRAEDGITNADLGIVSVGYFVAAATSLLVFGRLSNHLGRRPVALAALTSAAVACMLLIGMDGVLPLLVAQVLQGLACGLASTGLGSYVIDSAPERPRWLPAAITGSAPMLGIPIGALACGALVSYGPAPRVLIYEIVTAVLVVCAALMAMSPETMPSRRGAMASLRPRLQLPAGSGQLLLAAGAASVATWSLGGFYQAFGPSVAAEQLGTTNPLVAAAVFASVMVLNPLGGPLSGRLAPTTGLRAGMTLFVLALGGILVSLHAGAIVPFIAASLVVGVAQGAASTGGMRALLTAAQPEERAGLLSTIYLISYSGAAIPGMIAGKLTSTFDLSRSRSGTPRSASSPPSSPCSPHATRSRSGSQERRALFARDRVDLFSRRPGGISAAFWDRQAGPTGARNQTSCCDTRITFSDRFSIGASGPDRDLVRFEALLTPMMSGRSPQPSRSTHKYRLLGDVWERPSLAPRDRSLITLAALIARNQTVEMPLYLEPRSR